MYQHSKFHGLLKMALLAFLGGFLGIVVGLLLGIIISLVGYVLMSASPDVGFEAGMQSLYVLSTGMAMKGMISGAAIGAALGGLLGLKKKMAMMYGSMCGGFGQGGCCGNGSCMCCNNGECGSYEGSEEMSGEKMMEKDMPMKEKGMKGSK